MVRPTPSCGMPGGRTLAGAVTVVAVPAAGVGVAAPAAVTDPTSARGFADCESLAAFLRPRALLAEATSNYERPVVRGGMALVSVPDPDPLFGGEPDYDLPTTVDPDAESPGVAKLD